MSWLTCDLQSDFSLQNLPYGVFSTGNRDKRIGVGISDQILDLKVLSRSGVFDSLEFDTTTLFEPTLNKFASLGRPVQSRVRALLQELLRSNTALPHVLRDDDELRANAFVPMEDATMHLPMTIGEFTDYFTSPYHAKNCTEIFGLGTDVAPGFYKMPLGYGGRASSVVLSGTPVKRPEGQFLVDGEAYFGPTRKLDLEVEFAAFVGKSTNGKPVNIKNAEDHIFGVVLLNDWSARDIQALESNPLGPINSKNFCTTISPWVVTLDALEPYRTKTINPGPLLPYLDEGDRASTFDIPISVNIEGASAWMGPTSLYKFAEVNTKNTCFSFAQMLAHHTAGGCAMTAGDLISTGTLSGATDKEYGCMIEASWGGTRAHVMPSVDSPDAKPLRRTWLQDGDSVHFNARAPAPDGHAFVGFGGNSGRVYRNATN